MLTTHAHTGHGAAAILIFPLYHAFQTPEAAMSRDIDDPVISGYTILAVISFVIGGLVTKYVFNQEPPVLLLFAVFCLFLLFDTLNGIRNRLKRVEGKLDTILKKMSE